MTSFYAEKWKGHCLERSLPKEIHNIFLTKQRNEMGHIVLHCSIKFTSHFFVNTEMSCVVFSFIAIRNCRLCSAYIHGLKNELFIGIKIIS